MSEPSDRATLRTRVLDWNRQQKRSLTVREQAERLKTEGIVTIEDLAANFADAGFRDFLRETNRSTDPLTGRPSMVKCGQANKGSTGELWKSYPRASLPDKLYDFQQNVLGVERDISKLRTDWIRIYEEHREELDRPDAYRPPGFLFSQEEMAGYPLAGKGGA